MFYPENDLPCNACSSMRFHAVDGGRSAGFIDCDGMRVAVQYEHEPQAHLVAYPPLVLPARESAGEAFYTACLDEADELFFNFEFSPSSGRISWRCDLASGDAQEIDDAVERMRAFFSRNAEWLERTVLRCSAQSKPRRTFKDILKSILEV